MRARTNFGRAVLAVVWTAGVGLPAANCSAQSLFVIPTEASAAAPVADDQPLRIALHVRAPAALAKILGVAAPAPGTEVLEYVMDGYPAIQGTGDRRWIESSFVVDYPEPSVAKLSAEFRAALTGNIVSEAARRDALVRFVGATLHASHNRGFDVASQVALHRDGDCKAYAVLTVALARSVDIPARIVLGLALIRVGRRYGTFGHAWAEVQVEGRWVAADAAFLDAPNPVRYLPFGVMEDEGMGYVLDAARLTPVWVQRVDVLGGPGTEAPSP